MNSKRCGISVLELLVAAVVLAVLMGLVAQMLTHLARQRRESERRMLAVQEVANVMERLAAEPLGDLTPERVQSISLSRQAERSLPGAELNIEVAVPDDQPNAKRIRVELRWQNLAGETVAPVRLTTWRYQTREERP